MKDFCKFNSPDCYGARELELLLEISYILSNKDVNIDEVILLLAQHLDADRIIVTVLNRETSTITIEGSYGLGENERNNAVYKFGKGIISKVINTGETVLIKKIADSKEFLNLTKAPTQINGSDVSFICTPIRYKDEIIGTLSFHKVYKRVYSYDYDIRLLKIVGSMIGRTMRRRQEYAEEMEMLRAENQSLRGELRNRILPEKNQGKFQQNERSIPPDRKCGSNRCHCSYQRRKWCRKRTYCRCHSFQQQQKNKTIYQSKLCCIAGIAHRKRALWS